MIREEIDLKIWEWCEFKSSPNEPGLTRCDPVPCRRCNVCRKRSALWYSITASCNIIAPMSALIRRVIDAYELKTGRTVFVEKP